MNMALLKKKPHAVYLDTDFRGVALLHTCLKWYLTSLVLLAKAEGLPAPLRQVVVFGGSEGMGCKMAHLLLVLNSSLNFLIYCFVGARLLILNTD